MDSGIALVTTIAARCRTCYTCVRECPAKAIRIAHGQAEVVHERCIGCGNCVQVCSQDAKAVLGSVRTVAELLAGPDPVAAAVAPAFPAEFPDLDSGQLAANLRGLGFDVVQEVGFGADLVAEATRVHLKENPGRSWIASSCPAIVSYVEHYHTDLCESLLPLDSPMVACAKALREVHGENLRVVFIGPCIAKKGEAAQTSGFGRVDAALTFRELRELQFSCGDQADFEGTAAGFDAPRAGPGAIFPLSRGLVQAAGLCEDLTSGVVVSADGRQDFPEALREFESGDLDAELLDILCCNGCIMGAGMTSEEPMFRRRARLSRYVAEPLSKDEKSEWQKWMTNLSALDLKRDFVPDDKRMLEPSDTDLSRIMSDMGKKLPADELNCRACGYETCRAHAVAIFKGMAESEMCLPYVIRSLSHTVDELNTSHEKLASTQEQLMHSERLASMGQLAAGIAHEVNNPLGVVILYAHLLRDELKEAQLEDSPWSEELELIAAQADRCKGIVAGLLDFARQNKLELQTVRLSDLVTRSLRGCVVPPQIKVEVECADPDLTASLDLAQMMQVVTNLVSNAVASGGNTVHLEAGLANEDEAFLKVSDDGTGIDPANLSRIFEPFFTTKERGKGTGLGLAVSYGIVKMHRGEIQVKSNADLANGPTGTTFTVMLPIQGS